MLNNFHVSDMIDLLSDVADDTSATKTAIADHKTSKANFLSNLGF